MWETLRQDGRWQGEVCNRRKDGSLYPEWLSISTVTDEQGQVTHYVGIFSDITERKRQQAHIEFLAFHDPLTSLPNRQLLSDRFAVARALADRQGQRMAILFLDLDRFKTVNDTLGHQAGDQVLTQTARRLAEIVRESDTVCRLGGDEFVVVLQNLGTDPTEAAGQARMLGEMLRAHLAQPYDLAGHEHHCSASIGITLLHGQRTSVNEILKQADMAMYRAKDAGRNTLRFFDPDMQQAVNRRALLETDCPYMAPEPVRGTRNDSRNIAHVAAYIGTIWDMDAQAVLDQTAENARRCFGL
jgi:diguanylate cyclase (GGDEF)-like protein